MMNSLVERQTALTCELSYGLPCIGAVPLSDQRSACFFSTCGPELPDRFDPRDVAKVIRDNPTSPFQGEIMHSTKASEREAIS